MAAVTAALAAVVAGSSHKQEIKAIRHTESGWQGWPSSIVGDETAFLGVCQAAPLLEIDGSDKTETGPEGVTVVEAAQLVRAVIAWTVVVVAT